LPGDGYYRWKKLFLKKHGRKMIKTVLDANLFISAILKPDSNPAKIFELVKNKEATIKLLPTVPKMRLSCIFSKS